MLDWFKRIATPVPREQLAKNETQTLPAEGQVERLVGRLGTYGETGNNLAAGLT
jgi:hypothetical protein